MIVKKEYTCEIRKLSDSFFKDYPNSKYPEILKKKKRSYNCVSFKINDDFYICLPYRTEINHDYAYMFSDSVRSSVHLSGIDYSKMVIIKNKKYLGNISTVDNDEYKETYNNIDKIVHEASNYLNKYIDHCSGTKIIGKNKFKKMYQFSSLQYFHKELRLTE